LQITPVSRKVKGQFFNKGESVMTIVIRDKIPTEKFAQFHEILCATGGRYIRTPEANHGVITVDYEAGDYAQHNELWRRITTPITEVRKDQWWRVVFRRIALTFRSILT
jgi:hypothetical protein